MTRFGLNTIVINSDTRAEAKKSGRDLWVEARTGYTMVLNSQLSLQVCAEYSPAKSAEPFLHVACYGAPYLHPHSSTGILHREILRAPILPLQ